jgi:Tfp pilus assembly protein PilO
MLAQKLKAIKNYKFKSKRERNIVLVAAATIIGFCLFTFVIDPFFASQDRIRAQIPTKLKQLEKYRQFVARRAQVEAELQQAKRAANQCESMFLSGDTPPLAAANLQDVLKTLSSKNKIKIHSEKVLDSKEFDYFEQIPVQIDFTSSMRNLTNFIYDVETYKKSLSITDLNIRVTNRRQPKDIRATIVVAGLMQSKKEKNAQK